MNTKMRRAVLALALAVSWLAVAFTVNTLSNPQSNLWSPTTGTVSGLTLTNNYNNALDALNQCNNGSSAPTNQPPPPGPGTPSLGNCWLDTSAAGKATYKRYDGTQWVVLGTFDTTNHVWQPPTGGGVGTVTAASTTNLCDANQTIPLVVIISGATAINSFGTVCPTGTFKQLRFTGSNNITASGSILTPGGVNLITTATDNAVIVYAGSGVWAFISYYPANIVSCGTGVFNPATSAFNLGYLAHC